MVVIYALCAPGWLFAFASKKASAVSLHMHCQALSRTHLRLSETALWIAVRSHCNRPVMRHTLSEMTVNKEIYSSATAMLQVMFLRDGIEHCIDEGAQLLHSALAFVRRDAKHHNHTPTPAVLHLTFVVNKFRHGMDLQTHLPRYPFYLSRTTIIIAYMWEPTCFDPRHARGRPR